VRVSIANYETLLGNAVRRAIRHGDQIACPRITDLPYIVASFAGKIELETFEEGREGKLVDDLTRRAVLRVFGQHVDMGQLEEVVAFFEQGGRADSGSERRAADYPGLVRQVDGLGPVVRKLTGDDQRPEVVASAAEFVLEGLHLNRRLNCERTAAGYRYQK